MHALASAALQCTPTCVNNQFGIHNGHYHEHHQIKRFSLHSAGKTRPEKALWWRLDWVDDVLCESTDVIQQPTRQRQGYVHLWAFHLWYVTQSCSSFLPNHNTTTSVKLLEGLGHRLPFFTIAAYEDHEKLPHHWNFSFLCPFGLIWYSLCAWDHNKG